MKGFPMTLNSRFRFTGLLLWLLSAIFAIATFLHQNKTGPTYPLRGTVQTARGPVAFTFLRSEEIGTGLQIMLKDPVPAGVAATVQWRRYKSADAWSWTPMAPATFRFTRRGEVEELRGLGVVLPSLPERAGKYEYFVHLDDGTGARSVTGGKAVFARYKAPVPRTVLLPHILMIFISMTLALRTGLQALFGGPLRGLLWATIVSLLLGAFVLGPIVQHYAFGVWWSGVPFGYDWTDNKVLVELAAWLAAAALAGHPRRARAAVLTATLVTLAIYLIPHSVFGSEYDYTKGSGHGTAGAVAAPTR
jgi:hypothetical protein